MAEIVTEMIVPGTYIEVRSEGLIGVGGIITGKHRYSWNSIQGNFEYPEKPVQLYGSGR